MQIVMGWIKGDFKTGDVSRYGDQDTPQQYLKVQIEWHRLLGHTPIVLTNFKFKYEGIEAIQVPVFNEWSGFANKLPMLNWAISEGYINDDFLFKDCDVWTLIDHPFPSEVSGIGMVRHSVPGRDKIQGGVMYCRKGSYRVIDKMATFITKKKVRKEEKVLPGLLKDEDFVFLNYRYNLFRQGEFTRKYPLAQKPIVNVHFHPQHQCCWDRFVLGLNKYKAKVVPLELEEIMIKHGLEPKHEVS